MTRIALLLALTVVFASELGAQVELNPVPSADGTVMPVQNEEDTDTPTDQLPPIVSSPDESTTAPPPTRSAPRRSTRPASTELSMARIPNMIGDTTGGGIGALSISGEFKFRNVNNRNSNAIGWVPSRMTVAHPSLTSGLLNIAENNSPVVHDRLYVNYRHFHNASPFQVFGKQNDFNIDRLTLGAEKRVGQSSSFEFRLPVNYQMDSRLFAAQVNRGPNPPFTDLPLGEHDFQIGNIGMIYKCCLVERRSFYLSSGLGVNVPTGQDVETTTVFDDEAFPAFPRNPSRTADVFLQIDSKIRNETVNLSPFVGAIFSPNSRWFSHGFISVDVPVNSSSGEFTRTAVVNGTPLPTLQISSEVDLQPILRINTGIGRSLWRGRVDRVASSMAIMFEAHYSTTLADANTSKIQLSPEIGSGATVLTFGNRANRIDVLNFALGLPMVVGKYNVNPGVAVPISTGTNRGFDFEASFAVDRRY